jgi:hypothetical protein
MHPRGVRHNEKLPSAYVCEVLSGLCEPLGIRMQEQPDNNEQVGDFEVLGLVKGNIGISNRAKCALVGITLVVSLILLLYAVNCQNQVVLIKIQLP